MSSINQYAINDELERPSHEKLQKCASAILDDFRNMDIALEEEEASSNEGVYSWQKSSQGLRQAILRQLGALSGEKRGSRKVGCSRPSKRSKSCHTINTTSSTPTAQPLSTPTLLDKAARESCSQTSKLLDEVEQEFARRICQGEEERPPPVQHVPRPQRLWNPAEGGRIAQAFRAYGVPDTTEITKSALSFSEHEEMPNDQDSCLPYGSQRMSYNGADSMSHTCSSQGSFPATVTENSCDSKTDSDAQYVFMHR